MKDSNIVMNYSQVVNYLRGLVKEDMPESVFEDFICNIYVPNVDSYFVSYQDENGNVKVSCSSLGVEEIGYTINVSNDMANYKIKGFRKQFDGTYMREYGEDVIELQHDIINGNEWKLSKGKHSTKSTKVEYGLCDLVDEKVTSTISYDMNGVALFNQEEILHYPKRERQRNFAVGLLLKPCERIVNSRYRTSLQTVKTLQDVYNLNNNNHTTETFFSVLNSQHNLGRMDAIEGYIYNENEYNAEVSNEMNLSEEEVYKMLSHTPSPERDGLMEKYYPHLSRTGGRSL